MLLDAKLQVVQMEVAQVDDRLQVALVLALALPASGGMIPIPAGVVRFDIDKESAQVKGQEILDLAEQLPDPDPAPAAGAYHHTPQDTDFIIAKDLTGVEDIARTNDKLKGKG